MVCLCGIKYQTLLHHVQVIQNNIIAYVPKHKLDCKGRNDKAEQLGLDTWWNAKLMLSQASIILEYITASKEVFEYSRPSTIIKTLHHPFNKSLDSIKIHRPNIRQTLSDVLASKNWSKKYVKQECDQNGRQQTRQDKCYLTRPLPSCPSLVIRVSCLGAPSLYH